MLHKLKLEWRMINMTVKVFYTSANKATGTISKYMEANNIDYKLQNIEINPPTWDEFLQMIHLSEDGLEGLMPTKKSKHAMKLLETIDMDAITLKEYHQLIIENHILLRTPVVMNHKNIMVGLQTEELSIFDNKKDKKARFSQLLESVRMMEAYELQVELGYN